MARIPSHSLDDVPKGSRDGLEGISKRFGMTPNIYAQMAHAPAVIYGIAALGQAIEEHSTLDRRARETIALAVAAANHCDYCQAAHTMAAKAAGLTEEQTVQVRRGTVDDAGLDTLARVAREAAENTGSVSEPAWQAALDAGWSDTELAAAFALSPSTWPPPTSPTTQARSSTSLLLDHWSNGTRALQTAASHREGARVVDRGLVPDCAGSAAAGFAAPVRGEHRLLTGRGIRGVRSQALRNGRRRVIAPW